LITQDDSWSDKAIWKASVQCPSPDCENSYTAFEDFYTVPRSEVYKKGKSENNRYSKGSQQVLVFTCEEGHKFEILFGYHKGQTFVGSESV